MAILAIFLLFFLLSYFSLHLPTLADCFYSIISFSFLVFILHHHPTPLTLALTLTHPPHSHPSELPFTQYLKRLLTSLLIP